MNDGGLIVLTMLAMFALGLWIGSMRKHKTNHYHYYGDSFEQADEVEEEDDPADYWKHGNGKNGVPRDPYA